MVSDHPDGTVPPVGESEPESAADLTSDADDGADGVEQHDLAWQVPEWTMVPLAIVLAALIGYRFGADLVLVALIPLVVMLAAITIIDLRELRIPNAILRPSAIVGVPLLIVAAQSDWPDVSLVRALLGALAMGGLYLALGLINPRGMGFGDIKLAPFIGAALGLFGWIAWTRGLFLAFFIQAPIAIVLLLARRAGWKSGLPFGPFMAAGAVVALVLETI